MDRGLVGPGFRDFTGVGKVTFSRVLPRWVSFDLRFFCFQEIRLRVKETLKVCQDTVTLVSPRMTLGTFQGVFTPWDFKLKYRLGYFILSFLPRYR